jgi:Fur family ferric uptake transcriptional regulator
MDASSAFSDLLRQHGLKVTTQRLAVAEVVAEHGRHQTAEQVHARVLETLPGVSLTTVYKILNELVTLGRAQRIGLGDGTVRFDANVAPHAHLVCRRCGATEDVPASDYHAGLPAVATRGYQVSEVAVVFGGLCPACQPPRLTPNVCPALEGDDGDAN